MTAKATEESRGRTTSVRRSRFIMVFTAVALLVAAAQLFSIQIVRGAELAEQGRVVRTSASALQAPRGSIVDAQGNILVESRMTYHIAVNQQSIREYRHLDENGALIGEGPAEAALQLAPLLDMDPVELGGKFVGDSTYVYIAKNVEPETFREIRRLGIYGIEWEPVYERLYPGDNLAATVVGSIDSEGQGNSGLELIFNDELTGTPGEESYEIGPTGAIIPGAKVVSKEAVPGAIVNTTLVRDLQYSVQQALDQAVIDHQAEWGSAVVMDVETANVLALADSGTVSPAKGPQTSNAAQMVFEPGSVGKILTFSEALEQGVVGPETEFYLHDTYTVENGQLFSDMESHKPIYRTATGILAESLNTGTVMIGEKVSVEDRFDNMIRFGIGSKTGVQLPGESPGILTPYDTWDGRTFYTTMFGQGYAVNTIQAASIMATLGNGGVRLQPSLVSGVTLADGTVIETERAAPVEVVSSETAHTLITMMESVTTSGGSGYMAGVEGYRMAGKTGTAEIGTGGTIATMVALFPADNPQVAISVVLYKPEILYRASESAAPLVHQIALDAIRILTIAPSSEPPELFVSTFNPENTEESE